MDAPDLFWDRVLRGSPIEGIAQAPGDEVNLFFNYLKVPVIKALEIAFKRTTCPDPPVPATLCLL
jgi:hypothetical protein